MNQLMVNNSILEIFIGDLTNVEYDAVVKPTNSRLLPSGELRCKVLRAAGAKVQVKCNYLINELGLVPDCTAVVTSGGNLNVNNIIHVSGPKMAQKPEVKKLMHATWNSIKLADEREFNSIGVPSISKRVYLFTPKICADIMVKTINKYLTENNKNLHW